MVTSAIPLDGKAKEKIMAIVKDSAKTNVDLVEKVDGDIIGGFVLRIGDQQLDSSIRYKLNELEQEFTKNPYVSDL